MIDAVQFFERLDQRTLCRVPLRSSREFEPAQCCGLPASRGAKDQPLALVGIAGHALRDLLMNGLGCFQIRTMESRHAVSMLLE